MYKIELHLHTPVISPCGRVEPEEIVKRYKEAGYAGITVTDHFRMDVFKTIAPSVAAFLEGYRQVKEIADRAGLMTYYGAELQFTENGNDYHQGAVRKAHEEGSACIGLTHKHPPKKRSALRVRYRRINMAKARLENYNGYPAIVIDGVPYPPMTATIRTRLDGTKLLLDGEYFEALGKSGIKIFYVACDTLWLYPQAKELFYEEASLILERVPDAFLIPRISLHPSEQWMQEHRDEVVSYSDNKDVPVRFTSETYNKRLFGMYSLCSQAWREAAWEYLADMLDFFDTLPISDRIIGYFLAAGGTSEWYYYNPLENFETGAIGDTSPSFRREFQSYLQHKYGENAPSPDIPPLESRYFAEQFDLDMAHPPYVQPSGGKPAWPRREGHVGAFLDVDKYYHTFDFYRAWNEGTANSVAYFAKKLKCRDADKLVGAFYGSLGWSEVIFASNAGGVRRLLECPYLDFMANPGVYENRQPGGFTGQRQMHDSFRVNGKMYVVEDDTRTHAENPYFGDLAEMFSIEDTVNVLKRDFGRNICEDLQAWWFDQHIGGGRYKFPDVYKLFRRQQEIAKLSYELDRRKNSEIALVYDEESLHTVSKQTTVETVELFRNYELAKVGAPIDQYYHDDLLNPLMPDYKLYIFVNTFYLTDAERAAIRAKLSRNHALAVFCYAPGIINPDREKKLSVNNIYDLTGIRCELFDDRLSPIFKVCTDTLPYAQKGKSYGIFNRRSKCNISYSQKHQARSYLYPAVLPKENEGLTLARFCENGAGAITLKEMGDYTSILYGAKILDAEMVRSFAHMAHCHIYDEGENVLYANRNFITFHASSAGKAKIHLPEKCDVYELYEEKFYGTAVDVIEFDVKVGETKMFRLLDVQ